MLPTISVIVPIYNTEKYLKKCVDSILAQTFTNLEIILVDDGSQDNCPGICDDYKRKDQRIRVIHKENGGLADAKNAGLRLAKGEYIGFVDSVDYVKKDMYAVLYVLINQTDSDIAVCGFSEVPSSGIVPCPMFISDHVMVLEQMDAVKEVLLGETIKSYAWNKLYRSALFEGIEYPAGKYFEDTATTYKLFIKAKRVALTDATKYYYLQRDENICGNKINIKALSDYFNSNILVLEDIRENYPRYFKYCHKKAFQAGIDTYNQLLKYKLLNDSPALVNSIKKYIIKYFFADLFNKYVSLEYKTALVLFVLNKRSYSKFQSFYIKHMKQKNMPNGNM
jgi:glycosyltransferase involved in cell wall biosynthesis